MLSKIKKQVKEHTVKKEVEKKEKVNNYITIYINIFSLYIFIFIERPRQFLVIIDLIL
jgi:hypothetical protein